MPGALAERPVNDRFECVSGGDADRDDDASSNVGEPGIVRLSWTRTHDPHARKEEGDAAISEFAQKLYKQEHERVRFGTRHV